LPFVYQREVEIDVRERRFHGPDLHLARPAFLKTGRNEAHTETCRDERTGGVEIVYFVHDVQRESHFAAGADDRVEEPRTEMTSEHDVPLVGELREWNVVPRGQAMAAR